MAYGLLNGHVTDDVTSPWKVKTQMCFECCISKAAGDTDSVPKDYQIPIGNGILAIKRSSDRWRHVTPKVLCGSTVGYPSNSLASCL